MYACIKGNIDIVNMLLCYKVNIQIEIPKSNLLGSFAGPLCIGKVVRFDTYEFVYDSEWYENQKIHIDDFIKNIYEGQHKRYQYILWNALMFFYRKIIIWIFLSYYLIMRIQIKRILGEKIAIT